MGKEENIMMKKKKRRKDDCNLKKITVERNVKENISYNKMLERNEKITH
jgi:hypothetical protein